MIDPQYLAALRRQLRPELVITILQLRQVCPAWWADLSEMAEQLGTDRASLNRSITKLERLGLLKRSTIGNTGGTWVWWVKGGEHDQPRPGDEPGWQLSDTSRGRSEKVTIGQRWAWADRRGINRHTMRSFLNGHQLILAREWKLTGNPWDEVGPPCFDPIPDPWG